MRYLLFVSHGTLAEGMTEALRMLVGDRDDVRRVAFKDGMPLPQFREEVARVIEPFQPGDEVIVMADLVAGSPLTTTMDVLAGKLDLSTVRAVGGMNLPMAVTSVEGEDDPLDETFQAMIECAAEQVRPFNTDAGSGEDDDI